MRSAMLPLAIVMLPQVVLSVLQLGVPVLAPAFIAEAGLAPEAVGLIGGCIGFGSVWMFAANARVTPVLGPLRALWIACLLSSFGAFAIVTGWIGAIFPGAVLIGFAYAVTAPAGSQILSAHAPRPWWGTLFSIRQAGVPLGGAIAGLVGTGLAVAYGWRIGLGAMALIPLVCVVVLRLAPASYHGGASGAPFRLSALFNPAVVAGPFRTLRQMPQMRTMTLASLGFATVQGSLFSFFTTVLTDGLGFGLVLAGALYSTMQIISFAGRLAAGVLADWLGAIRPVLIAMSLSSAMACLMMAAMDASWPEPLLFAVAAFVGIAAATWNGLFLAEIARLSPPEQVSEATAGVTFFTFVAYMMAPPIFAGLSIAFGYQGAFLYCACAALGSFAVLVRTRKSA